MLPIFIIFYYSSGALLTEFSSINKEDKIPSLSKKILNEKYLKDLRETIKNFYNFAIIESDGNFLLSDQFVSTSALRIKSRFPDISNRHIGLKETLILIPLTANYYIAYWHTERSFFINPDCINYLNMSIPENTEPLFGKLFGKIFNKI